MGRRLRQSRKKNIVLRREGNNMATILELTERRKIEKPYSFLEMILNPHKRKQTYDYYDNQYEETKDEKEIFETMTKRRKRWN